MSQYTPLQSGEYTVTYTKTLANNSMDTCEFPLFVGAPGLRVELTWEWPSTQTVDVDLHLHRPGFLTPWGGSSGNPDDCAYSNCASPFQTLPTWFSTTNTPPDPVNWYLDPVLENNTCYFGPKGSGAIWQANAQGCHNPRLDSDNINCDPSVTDSQGSSFCNPENINIDFPSTDWTRIGVHYYSNHGHTYDVHPQIKIFCNGALAAELGNTGYNAPVTFPSAVGGTAFWLVADVAFYPPDECSDGPACEVRPVFMDSTAQTPLISTDTAVEAGWVGPAYPPPLVP
jgi:hypothetical protein